MKGDSISKALRDAEKCVELAPQWSKGYSRLGAAQHGLKRFQAAIETYRRGNKSSL
jgi:predicted TPR repeat methyltransferase